MDSSIKKSKCVCVCVCIWLHNIKSIIIRRRERVLNSAMSPENTVGKTPLGSNVTYVWSLFDHHLGSLRILRGILSKLCACIEYSHVPDLQSHVTFLFPTVLYVVRYSLTLSLYTLDNTYTYIGTVFTVSSTCIRNGGGDRSCTQSYHIHWICWPQQSKIYHSIRSN